MAGYRHPAQMTVLLCLLVAVGASGPVGQELGAVSARTWIGREAEIETYLQTAEIVGLSELPVGVTNPKAADLAPGGPVDRFAWKPIRPGVYRGYFESYKAEIAAYELDQLLGLGMVPVAVERRIRGELGAAIMWLRPTQSFRDLGGVPTPPIRHLGYWTIQLIRAKMFDNLINNRDPNEGNWLVDPAWNLMLIDHSRSFAPGDEMAHDDMTRVDRYLWERMRRLDAATLTEALGQWLTPREIRAVLERRDRMADIIDERVAERGEATVLIRYGLPPGVTAPASGADDLLGRLVAAADEALIVAPSSELTWVGTVVTLEAYEGRYAPVAEAGVAGGYRLGLVAKDGGVLCLTRSERDPEPYGRLRALVGRQVEIFGVLVDGTELPVVEVTAARTP